MKKTIFSAIAAFIFSAASAFGGGSAYPIPQTELQSLKASDLAVSAEGLSLPMPQAPAAEPASGGMAQEDADILSALEAPELEEIFSRGPEAGEEKELLSDFQTRYLVRGYLDFKVSPPILTSDTGKVFVVRGYPFWFRLIGSRNVCVEGYVRQQDSTREIRIARALPPEELASVTPQQGVLELYKTASIVSRSGGVTVLDNVAWNLRHLPGGGRAEDGHGNFITEWRDGVRVRPALLEKAYFVKKSSTGRPRYGNHGLLMFKFRPGGVTTADGRQAQGLAVSLDAYYKSPTDSGYSQVDGLRGKYMVYYSVSTLERYAEAKTARGKDVIYTYPLVLSQERARRLLDNALAKAAENKLGEMYSLIYNSCTNAAVSLINGVLEDDRKIRDGWLPEIVYRLGVTIPDTAAAVLIRRGIARPADAEVGASNYRIFANY